MNEFSFRELECFLAVSEELSFTRAAERLHLAQPPLSRHIRSLEEKLGVQLFERTNRRVLLTSPGEAFRGEAKEILLQIRRAGEAARRAGAGETGRLDIGFVSAVLSPELVRVFADFRRGHADIQLNLHDRLPADQFEALVNGELEIGFIGITPQRIPDGIRCTNWMEEPLSVYLPPRHPLGAKGGARIKDLKGEPFVMISSDAAPAYAAYLRELCLEEGFRPRIVQEARRAQAVAAMTVAGSGIAILPESLNRITGNGVPLLGARRKRLKMTHAVAHRDRISATAELFIQLLGKTKKR
ncbi:MAG: LysR substrate-binding domain-containing protein [Verrucomicrobiales bacterium]|nr:LysR substrate-binding domain-containing protein [Verrucomicrobiales bacterium]